MSFISPSLISRIFSALGQNRGSDAVLLLRQHSFKTQGRYDLNDSDLIFEVIKLADENLYGGHIECAEEHYRLALALYENLFTGCHAEALRCTAGLTTILQRQGRLADISAVLDETENILDCLRKQASPKAVAL